MKINKFLGLSISLLLSIGLSSCVTKDQAASQGPKGDKGDQGETGPAGPAGADGLPGTDGATWISDDQAPTRADGKDGDFYLDTTTYNIYLKNNGSWSKIGNIKGEDGSTPTIGISDGGYWIIDGYTTTVKAIGEDGSTPVVTIGNNGNWFIDGVDTNKKAQGPQGIKGEDGVDGKDGKNGKDGADGQPGKDGKDGKDGAPGADGEDGAPGQDGKSAFEIAVENGYVGTEEQWLATLKGEDGEDGKDGSNGLPGTNGSTWLTGNGQPLDDSGKNEDLYLDLETYDLYIKSNDNWNPVGNIKGATGEKGHDADTYGITYTVSFDSNGGELIDSEDTVEAKYGEKIDLPLVERDGFIFTGWFTGFGINDGKFSNSNSVTSDMVLYAGWEAEDIYSIYYHSNGGTNVETSKIANKTSVNELPSPLKMDCAFAGWYYDEELNNRVSYPFVMSNDLDLYAKWETAYYQLSYDTVGGDEIESDVFIAGAEVNELPTPSKLYKAFSAWYFDSGYTKLATIPFEMHENTTLYAKWNNTNSTISFNTNGGNEISDSPEITGSYVTQLPTPTKDSYSFLGWFTDPQLNSPVELPYLVTGDQTFYAKWSYVDPYPGYTRISTFNQLKAISNMSGKYVLTQDIDCLGGTITTIGTEKNPFKGIFDGAGHTISNILINANGSDLKNYGLFAYNNGTIKNVKIDNGIISLNNPADASEDTYRIVNVGVVGTNTGSLSCISSNLSITVSSNYYNYRHYVGGIAGQNISGGNINNCIFTGSINSTVGGTNQGYYRHYVGGICGYQDNSSVAKCVYAGSMTAEMLYNDTLYSTRSYISGIANGGTVMDSVALKSFTQTRFKNADAVSCSGIVTGGYKYSGISQETTTGQSASLSQINSALFYTGVLKFDSEIWDCASLNYNSGKYVSLI